MEKSIMINVSIKTPSQFVAEIETIVKETGMNHFDACMHYADKANVEIETVASLIKGSQILKSKIQVDAEKLHMLKGTSGAKLPI
jgi:hypothetical protein